jgi:hypothetical protein
VDGVWVESPLLIRQATVDFFSSHFLSVEWQRPSLGGVAFPILSVEANVSLLLPFSMEEIEGVVMESDGNKSPGPDGFNFAFIKKCWSLLRGEIRIMFDQFHGTSILPKSFLSYFITLIPKVDSPFTLDDYRPISLLG